MRREAIVTIAELEIQGRTAEEKCIALLTESEVLRVLFEELYSIFVECRILGVKPKMQCGLK